MGRHREASLRKNLEPVEVRAESSAPGPRVEKDVWEQRPGMLVRVHNWKACFSSPKTSSSSTRTASFSSRKTSSSICEVVCV